MLNIDKNALKYFKEEKFEKIKIFFYNAWCSGTKVNITDNFDITENLLKITLKIENHELLCFFDKKDKEKFQNCSITRIIKADHNWKEKISYIYSSENVKSRCWCWSSFSFWEDKEPKIKLESLKKLKWKFNKK